MNRFAMPTYAVLLAAFLFAPVAFAGTTVWLDGDFPDADWDIISWHPPLDIGDSDATLAFTIGHGGNPDALRAMGETIGDGPDDGAVIVQINNQWTWDPAAQGAVTAIHGGFEFQWTIGGPARIGLAIEQDGNIYLHVLATQAADTTWTPYGASSLTAVDFPPIDPDATGQPDFSTTGSEMRFGYAVGQLAGFADGSTSFYQYVDNVSLTLTADPVSAVRGEDFQTRLVPPVVYPNPFNPRTEITFEMPAAGFASLRIFDLSGRLVRTLASRNFGQGDQSVIWQGKSDAGTIVSSGVYLAVLETGGAMASQRLTLTR